MNCRFVSGDLPAPDIWRKSANVFLRPSHPGHEFNFGRLLGHRALHHVAERHGATPAQVALAWLLGQEGVIAIPKAVSAAHIHENRRAADLHLDERDLADLEPPRVTGCGVGLWGVSDYRFDRKSRSAGHAAPCQINGTTRLQKEWEMNMGIAPGAHRFDATAEMDPRWARILERDRSADGTFVYAVATTGVYCRPSCPSRTANPRNVRFFDTFGEAEAAGFRPCRRCRPNEPPLQEQYAAKMADICRRIETEQETPNLAALAKAAGLSPYHFHRVFKAIIGVTPREYAEAHRTKKVHDALSKAGSVTEAIYDAGFSSSSRFYERSGTMLGMTPRDYRAGGTSATIRFAIGDCSLGSILIAMSEKGACAILLGDDPDALLRDLQDRFPRAHLIGGDSAFEEVVAQVVGFVEAPGTGLDLPLDVRGTAFQQRVWQALRDIPAGTTASYAEIARRIGAPGSVRAVANACAANLLAVAIPCHRVVRNDGALSGYRWGVERKQALIEREANPA